MRESSNLSQIQIATPSFKSYEVEKTLQISQMTPEVTNYSMIDENVGYIKSGV
jgi:hypothetical protein